MLKIIFVPFIFSSLLQVLSRQTFWMKYLVQVYVVGEKLFSEQRAKKRGEKSARDVVIL